MTTQLVQKLAALPPEQALKVLHIRKARLSPSFFNSFCFTDPAGQPWIQQPFHEEWLAALLSHPKVQIEAFRESAKTEQISIGYSLWRLGRNPNLRVKVVSADDALAKAILGAVASHIVTNERVHEVFPRLRPDKSEEWNSERVFVQRDRIMKDASFEAHGVLSSGVGGRCDLLIFDDVCNFRNTILQPAMKRLVAEAIDKVWMKLVTSAGQIVWLDTPWAPDDASSIVMHYPDFHHIRHPVYKRVRSRTTGEVKLTSRWPERHPDALLQADEQLRPISFKTQMLLDRHASSGSSYFPFEVIESCRDLSTPELGDAEPGHVYVSFWDLGRHVNRKGRNATVCITLDITSPTAYIRHGRSYVNVPYTAPTLETFSVASEIVRTAQLYPGETIIESNAAGEAVIESLPITVTPFRTTQVTKTPMLQNLLNQMTSGSLKWYPSDELEEMETQLRNYTLQDDGIAQDWCIALSGAALSISPAGGSGIVI